MLLVSAMRDVPALEGALEIRAVVDRARLTPGRVADLVEALFKSSR